MSIKNSLNKIKDIVFTEGWFKKQFGIIDQRLDAMLAEQKRHGILINRLTNNWGQEFSRLDYSMPTWKGVLLHTSALRRSDQHEDARAIEEHVFARNGKCISVLHATRRPDEALRVMFEWMASAYNPCSVEWVFGIAEDDENSKVVLQCFRTVIVPGPNKGPVAAWNLAAKESSGKILVQMSDDWMPTLHWDKLIVDRMGDTSRETVLAVSDGYRKDDLLCMAILSRPYYERYGYIFWHEYFSMYSDNEFTLQAQRDGVIQQARDLLFTHDHPVRQGKQYDEFDSVYKLSNSSDQYRLGEEIFTRREPVIGR
jgi:hypothetical protein